MQSSLRFSLTSGVTRVLPDRPSLPSADLHRCPTTWWDNSVPIFPGFFLEIQLWTKLLHWQHSCPTSERKAVSTIFIRTWLRYVWVFAIANSSVCRLSSACRL